MLPIYFTIQKDGQAETIIKKSTFIATLARVETAEQAQEKIQQIKKEHWKATHNCSAFIIGENNQIQRASDDGEPTGTAGVPMLEILKKKQLKNTLVVVTRYFGGIKLGAGGLVRAYSQAVVHGIETVGIVKCTKKVKIAATMDYPHLGKVENAMAQSPFSIAAIDYTDQVTVHFFVEESQKAVFKEQLINLLSSQVTFLDEGTFYHEVLVE
ncbi:YigZ family protein [Isobaculum melis]|uniref:Uncharacterized protein, YigZ family n=1 Tax=Isobaculum melis TaxID=142588 RepID=A0A1H9QNA8_9LACT|nr:YigZ family protein [Isobaculum melis]SER61887.1 uncharacterized protein, YigZ family [Isobaculum melis]